MKKRHGLVISWFYPPGNSSEGLVTYKLLKNSIYTYDVFTRKSHDADMFDRKVTEEQLVAPNINVVAATTNDNDAWVAEAVSYFKNNHQKYDFIMTRCMTAAAHDAGTKIKSKYADIPWIASFGDPLENSPYIPDIKKGENPHMLRNKTVNLRNLARTIISPTRRANKILWEWQRKQDMRLTKYFREVNEKTFRMADKLIFNNSFQKDHAFEDGKYQKFINKAVILNHSFDKSMYPAKKDAQLMKGPLKFVYVGHLDGLRNAQVLIEAIHKLKLRHSDFGKLAHFDFYGHMDSNDKAKIIDYDIADVVSVNPDADYLTSLKKITNADWAVLIDANLSDKLDKYIFCPAKLADYMGANKSVLAITQTPGATDSVIKSVNCGCVVPHDVNDVCECLKKIINGEIRQFVYNSKVSNFDAKNVAENFDRLVEELIKKEVNNG